MKRTGFNPKYTITNQITSHLTRIKRARGFLEAAMLSEEWVREMGELGLVLETHPTPGYASTGSWIERSSKQGC